MISAQPGRAEASAAGKTLVAYFSWSGNTKQLAGIIRDKTGGDIFEIKRVEPYAQVYSAVLDQARDEKRKNARPQLAARVENIKDYDTVFVGFPIWSGDLPMPVYTFLETYDFSGKKVIPFCTHGGGGSYGVFDVIAQELADAGVVGDGLSISGSRLSEDGVLKWLRGRDVI